MRLWSSCIPDPIYSHGVELVIGGTPDDLQRHIRSMSGDDSYEIKSPMAAGACVQYEGPSGEIYHWIWLESWSASDVLAHGRLVHECYHHMRHVMAMIRLSRRRGPRVLPRVHLSQGLRSAEGSPETPVSLFPTN
jgi:hypothetical protein